MYFEYSFCQKNMTITAAFHTTLTFVLPDTLIRYRESRGEPLGYILVDTLLYSTWFDAFNFEESILPINRLICIFRAPAW
jgi:hypothetical protein